MEVITFDRNFQVTFVEIRVEDDMVYEGDERFLAVITPQTEGVEVEGGPATITIGDDEDCKSNFILFELQSVCIVFSSCLSDTSLQFL